MARCCEIELRELRSVSVLAFAPSNIVWLTQSGFISKHVFANKLDWYWLLKSPGKKTNIVLIASFIYKIKNT